MARVLTNIPTDMSANEQMFSRFDVLTPCCRELRHGYAQVQLFEFFRCLLHS